MSENRRFRITSAYNAQIDGLEFEVLPHATPKQIAESAQETVMEFVEYGYEEIDEKGASDATR